MQNEAFERLAALRNDEQAPGRSVGDERLLNRAAAGDELLVGAEEVRRSDGRRRGSEPGRRFAPGPVRASTGS